MEVCRTIWIQNNACGHLKALNLRKQYAFCGGIQYSLCLPFKLSALQSTLKVKSACKWGDAKKRLMTTVCDRKVGEFFFSRISPIHLGIFVKKENQSSICKKYLLNCTPIWALIKNLILISQWKFEILGPLILTTT